MKRLKRSILEDYEVPLNAPSRVRAVQFGDDALLMGLFDRLIDEANARSLDVGIAVVQPGASGLADLLAEQDGLFTVYVRGEQDEVTVKREHVVQCVLAALNPDRDDEALTALARDPEVAFAVLHPDESGERPDEDAVNEALAARFLAERWRAGLAPLHLIVIGESAECGELCRGRLIQIAREWRAGEAFEAYLKACPCCCAFADCLVFRSSAEEAARLMEQSNFQDAMIHIAEPYGLLDIRADGAFRKAFPLDVCPQIRFVDDLSTDILIKSRVFDAGLFIFSSLGLLHGNATLAECMKDEPLRDLAGRALLDELLPGLPVTREEAAPWIIRSWGRFENPLNDNRLTDVGRSLIYKCNRGILPAIRAYADEHFEPPKGLTMALTAAILLLADARPGKDGYETIVDDKPVPVHEAPHVLRAFSSLSSDMSPDSLAYAVLSDRTLWDGADLREIDGLLDAVTENLSS